MKHLDWPSFEEWEERRCWFENKNEEFMGEGMVGYSVSEQACALIAEVQSVFCAGAWIAVIILVVSVIDAQLRETETPDFMGSTKELIKIVAHNDSRLQRLRKRRNSLVHVNIENPAITVDEQWEDRKKLEKDASEAIELMFEAFFSNPWI